MKHSTIPAVADHLLRARGRIVRDGWCSNGLGDDGKPVCPLGAVYFEGRESFAWKVAYRLLQRALPPDASGDVPVYSNAPGRTLEEILALFDRAIELALSAP